MQHPVNESGLPKKERAQTLFIHFPQSSALKPMKALSKIRGYCFWCSNRWLHHVQSFLFSSPPNQPHRNTYILLHLTGCLHFQKDMENTHLFCTTTTQQCITREHSFWRLGGRRGIERGKKAKHCLLLGDSLLRHITASRPRNATEMKIHFTYSEALFSPWRHRFPQICWQRSRARANRATCHPRRLGRASAPWEHHGNVPLLNRLPVPSSCPIPA